MLPFLTAAFEYGWGHGVVACTIAAIMACLDQHIQIFSRGRK
jgi:glucose-6-phosphate-specific signal transduction histidine kinase